MAVPHEAPVSPGAAAPRGRDQARGGLAPHPGETQGVAYPLRKGPRTVLPTHAGVGPPATHRLEPLGGCLRASEPR